MQTFRDRAVQSLLYEHDNSDAVRAMLEQSPTNSRVNQAMAWWCVICDQVCGNWKGAWKNLFGDMVTSIQKHQLNLEGYSRVQAINMSASRTVTEQGLQQQQGKKGGILGIFS